MLLLPNALGPHSMPPWNHPITLSLKISLDTDLISSLSLLNSENLIELSLRNNKSNSVKKTAMDTLKAYLLNEERLEEGEVYFQTEIYCGGRYNANGDIGYLVPSLNDFSIVELTDEDRSVVAKALSYGQEIPMEDE